MIIIKDYYELIMNDNRNNETLRFVYFLRVYIYPSLLAILIFGILSFITYYLKLDRSDLLFGGMFGAIIGFLIHVRNRVKWIVSDNSYTYIGKTKDEHHQDLLVKDSLVAEPTIYIMAFYTRLSDKIMTILCGLIIIGAGIYIMSKSSVIFPSILMLGGFIMIYSGYKHLKDRAPKLKLTKEGLWTKQLGYKYWELIERCEFVKEKSGRPELTYLFVFLKSNEFDIPDDRILINELKDGSKIKELIEELLSEQVPA